MMVLFKMLANIVLFTDLVIKDIDILSPRKKRKRTKIKLRLN